MRRTSTLTAAALVLAIAVQSWANFLPVNANTVVQDGIEYYVETDKGVYDLGEDVEIIYRITNQTDEEWTVGGVGRMFDVVVESIEGEVFREVW